MSELVIRNAGIDDIEPLSQLMMEYIADFYRQPLPSSEAVHQFIQHLLDHPSSGMQWVAEIGPQKLAGFSTLYFTFSTTRLKKAAILNDLYVASSFRGKKIGEQLFSASLEFTKTHQYAYMAWETEQTNAVAQGLYEKMGGINKNKEWVHYEIAHSI